MSFERVIGLVLEHEGGYANNPADPGGETNFGISKRAYPHLDIKAITRDQAKDIYRRDYWDRLTLGALDADPMLRGSILDMAVNAGRSRAIKLLQRSANAFLASEIAEDGGMGPVTRGAVAAIEPIRLLRAYTAIRLVYYMGLARSDPSQKQFLGGWVNRSFSWVEDPPLEVVEAA